MTDDAARPGPPGGPFQPPPGPPSYPPSGQPYPPSGPSSYPPSGPSSYPPVPQAYPPQHAHPGRSSQQQGYPPQQPAAYPPPPAYPPSPQGYPPQQPGYPPQAGYVTQAGYLTQPGQPAQPGQQPGPGQPSPSPGGGRSGLALTAGIVVGLLVLVLVVLGGAFATSRLLGSDDPDPLVSEPLTPVPAPLETVPEATASPIGPTEPAISVTPTPPPVSPTPTPSGRIGSSVALSKGDCIQSLPKGQTILTVTLVPCTTAHAAQVGVTFSPSGAAYPGGAKLEATVRTECPKRLGAVIRADAPALSWTGYYPEALEWAGGDHSIKCLVLPQNGKPLNRSVIK